MFRVLLVHHDRLESRIEDFAQGLGGDVELYSAHDARGAFNQFYEIEFMKTYKAIFVGFGLEGLNNTISGGLVRKFIEEGFGTREIPLIATSTEDNNFWLTQAGCNLQTDLSDKSLRKILGRTIEEDNYWRRYKRQMLRAG